MSTLHRAALPAGAPSYWKQATRELMRRDRILKGLIETLGYSFPVAKDNPFVTLVRAIVGQQISVKAAESVWRRLGEICPSCTPSHIARAGESGLSRAGLSRRKVEYLLNLAQHFRKRTVQPERWTEMPDEAVVAELQQIRGVGRWTAEMFLIFSLQRPNVLPMDDIGLLRGIGTAYFSEKSVSRSSARELAENWKPWCTVATWYLWRSLDPIPVEY
ncbi:MAG: DNA-3-methyladenine glycosylase 2 family protein [Burkholderiaceae bacterium]|nr:DNA-3-methyladenine glycosylase 2 family protein [Burkholderiaceae bacterium]